jgi:hypothetical protein
MDLSQFERVDIYDEELIAKVMNFLMLKDPSHATHDDAISYLKFMQRTAKEIATRVSIDNFDDFYQAFKETRN